MHQQSESGTACDAVFQSSAGTHLPKLPIGLQIRAKQNAEESVGRMEVKLNALEADEVSRRLSDPTINFPPHEFSDELQRLGQVNFRSHFLTLQQTMCVYVCLFCVSLMHD